MTKEEKAIFLKRVQAELGDMKVSIQDVLDMMGNAGWGEGEDIYGALWYFYKEAGFIMSPEEETVLDYAVGYWEKEREDALTGDIEGAVDAMEKDQD